MARDTTKINYEKKYLEKQKKIKEILKEIKRTENIEAQRIYCKIMNIEVEDDTNKSKKTIKNKG